VGYFLSDPKIYTIEVGATWVVPLSKCVGSKAAMDCVIIRRDEKNLHATSTQHPFTSVGPSSWRPCLVTVSVGNPGESPHIICGRLGCTAARGLCSTFVMTSGML
jgi:hypothetical protein